MRLFRELFCIVYLLLLNTNGKFLVDHETGVMKRNCSALLNVSLFHYYGRYNQSECPLWFNRDNQTGLCRAGPTLNGIIQQDMSTLQTSIMQCYCMTEEDGVFTVAGCLHKCLSITPYYQLPCQVSQLQNYTCPPSLKRNGTLCSKCMDGYAYPVYSYKIECVMCKDYEYNWLKYLAAAYLPLTLFYIVVALFSISFTSPVVIGLIMVCQLIASPLLLQLLERFASDTKYGKFLKLSATIEALFNLDFGRIYYSFCLNPTVSAIELKCLDYGIVVFPVFLILLTNLLVGLHSKGVRPVVWCWSATTAILRPLRQKLRVKTSLIDVFASFLYLSLSRLLITSMYIMMPQLYYQTLDGSTNLVTRHGVFNEPALVYFGKGHKKYALLAILMFLLFYILPVFLLFAYPFSCFQRLLNKAGLNSVVLRTFIDVFQGYYKDGTNGTRDYRFFSVFPFLLISVEYATFTVATTFSYYFGCFVILIYITVFWVLQPFKQFKHNFITGVMLICLVIACWSMIINNISASPIYGIASNILLVLSLCLPFVYVLGLACHLMKKVKV